MGDYLVCGWGEWWRGRQGRGEVGFIGASGEREEGKRPWRAEPRVGEKEGDPGATWGQAAERERLSVQIRGVEARRVVVAVREGSIVMRWVRAGRRVAAHRSIGSTVPSDQSEHGSDRWRCTCDGDTSRWA